MDKTLDFAAVEPYIKTDFIGRSYGYFDTIDSTNLQCKRDFLSGTADGRVVASEEQTGGRGRMGRAWKSPKYTGIWLSVLTKPKMPVYLAPRITVVAAAAIYVTLRDMGIDAKIKWPNDIVINGKKICGILTEMSTTAGEIDYVVMGIGINVNMTEFPEDLRDKATSIRLETGREFDRGPIAAEFLNNYERLYSNFVNTRCLSEVMDICREGSVLIGRDVKIIDGNEEFTCHVEDINGDGELVVRMENGEIKNIYSGEVSVRGIYGYV